MRGFSLSGMQWVLIAVIVVTGFMLFSGNTTTKINAVFSGDVAKQYDSLTCSVAANNPFGSDAKIRDSPSCQVVPSSAMDCLNVFSDAHMSIFVDKMSLGMSVDGQLVKTKNFDLHESSTVTQIYDYSTQMQADCVPRVSQHNVQFVLREEGRIVDTKQVLV